MSPSWPHTAEPAIEARAVTRTVDDRPVLDRVAIAVGAGESVALVGPNGAGKTTLLRCLASEIRPASGQVLWFGRPPSHDARRLVGFVSHETRLYSNLTVRENLEFAAAMCDVPHAAPRIDGLVASTGLARYAHEYVGRLSRGVRQRLAILRTLVHEPRIVLLDEPTTGLDAQAICWFGRLVGDCRDRGCAICFSTHDTELVQNLATRTVQLHAGRLTDSEHSLRVVPNSA